MAPKKVKPKKKAPAKKKAVVKAKVPEPLQTLNVRTNKGFKYKPGNRFWEMRSSHGRKPIFGSPDVLWNAATEYFDWVDENPLMEMKPFAYQGVVVQEPVAKMRAMTIQGLCIFLDISDETWHTYRKNPDFVGICTTVERVIYQQKLTGAAADLLNPVIIARELGLKDQVSNEVTGRDGGPIEMVRRTIVRPGHSNS